MAAAHYRAFISYSHQDEAWARWLQVALERYRVPRRLIGTAGRCGPISGRLQPIFRDREDLSTASDLTARIKQELAASETLIVICSPAAAASRWVDEEIGYFQALGRGDRILALIVAGDPESRDPAQHCFPQALRFTQDGSPGNPLAADVRRYADGRRLALLKLVAGMLGIRLDELRRRDAQARLRRRFGWSATALVTLGVIAWLAYTALVTREAARAQRTNTEELLSFMLGDLKRLDPIVGLELVDEDDPELQRYRDELGFDSLSEDALVARAMALREEGIALRGRGELVAALERFQQSRAALVELHRREGGTRRALFELGQAEFWVGYVRMDLGALDDAQASFARYGAVTRRLVNAEPNNAGMVMELAYTLTNLGAIERSRQRPDRNKILQLFQSAVQYNQMALVLEPDNDLYRQNLATILRFLADAWLDFCDLGNAFALQAQSVSVSRELHQAAPGDAARQRDLAFALSGLATVQQQMGLASLAADSLRESARLLDALDRADPGNASLHWQALLRSQRLARLAIAEGRLDEAWALAEPLESEVGAFLDGPSTGEFLALVDAARFRLDHARLLWLRGFEDEGRQALDQAMVALAGLVRQNPGHRDSLFQLAYAAVERWHLTGAEPGTEVGQLLDGYLEDSPAAGSCAEASMAARLALLRGDRERAAGYTGQVLAKGYFEPEFIAFCRLHALCDLGPGDRPAPAAKARAVSPAATPNPMEQ